jgi:hypothetical protein
MAVSLDEGNKTLENNRRRKAEYKQKIIGEGGKHI